MPLTGGLQKPPTEPAEPVDLDVVVSRVVAELEAAIAESGAVIQRRALPTVVADRAGLEMVMENLISNAITYRRDVPPRIVIEASAAGDTWEIRCRDNGTGIPDDLGDAIFQPFVRGDPSTSGSGLGLATCRRIVERFGGRLWIDESSETGTCIAFTLLRDAPGVGRARAAQRVVRDGHRRVASHAPAAATTAAEIARATGPGDATSVNTAAPTIAANRKATLPTGATSTPPSGTCVSGGRLTEPG